MSNVVFLVFRLIVIRLICGDMNLSGGKLMKELHQFVKKTFSEVCNVDSEEITSTTNLFADLGIESVDFLDVCYLIDEKYNIRIPIGEWMGRVNEGDDSAADLFVLDGFVKAVKSLVEAESEAEAG
jgi:acyl carrier protein